MKSLTYSEAYDRLENGQIVIVSNNHEDDKERVLISADLEEYINEDVSFLYDDVAEAEAESIFQSLREEVKDYLYMLLLSENNILQGLIFNNIKK